MSEDPKAKAASPGRLHLGIEDEEDLRVVSAVLQDAVVRAGDISFLRSTRRLALIANRFCWELQTPARVRAGLQFETVRAVRFKGIDRDAAVQTLNLLAVSAGEAPQGIAIDLVFAGGAAIRIEAEAIGGSLKDLTEPQPTRRRPVHPLDGEEDA